MERYASSGIELSRRADRLKWCRYFVDFSLKNGMSPRDADVVGPFLRKLASKGQGPERQERARIAVAEMQEELARFPAPAQGSGRGSPDGVSNSAHGAGGERRGAVLAGVRKHGGGIAEERREAWIEAHEKLEDRFATGQYATRTRKSYRTWVRQFQGFLEWLPPSEIDSDHAARFLTHIARKRKVSASAQNQAFNALLFLFRHVLEKKFEPKWVTRAKRRKNVPTVLSQGEIRAIAEELPDPHDLIARLLYGCGLRLAECLELRVRSLNFDTGKLTVFRGKGGKDRTVPLPKSLFAELEAQLERVRAQFETDQREVEGFAGSFAPEQGSPRTWVPRTRKWPWQFGFPAKTLTVVMDEGCCRRYHVHGNQFNAALRRVSAHLGLHKRVTSHAFRHSFASHLLTAGYDIKTIQELLGHSDVRTTMIYVQTVPTQTLKEARSPLDLDLRGKSSA